LQFTVHSQHFKLLVDLVDAVLVFWHFWDDLLGRFGSLAFFI